MLKDYFSLDNIFSFHDISFCRSYNDKDTFEGVYWSVNLTALSQTEKSLIDLIISLYSKATNIT